MVEINMENSSAIAVEGSSNLRSINCDAAQIRFPHKVGVDLRKEAGHLVLDNARILLDVKQLDCGAKLINRDMLQTLKADEHPHIVMDLLSISLPHGRSDLDHSWREVQADVRVQMAGVIRHEPFVFQGRKVGPNQYQISGSHEIRLSNYCLEPPTAMMGLLKVDDCFLIRLDLRFQAS